MTNIFHWKTYVKELFVKFVNYDVLKKREKRKTKKQGNVYAVVKKYNKCIGSFL